MNKIIDTKKVISKESNINLNFYDHDKYLGILLKNKSEFLIKNLEIFTKISVIFLDFLE